MQQQPLATSRELQSSLTRIGIRALILALGISTRASAQKGLPKGVIDGAVTDTALMPLAGVLVSLEGHHVSVVAGPGGRYRISGVPSGSYSLLLRKFGYVAARAEANVIGNDTVLITTALIGAPLLLDSVRTTAVAGSDFATHRMQGGGQYMTAEEIERRNVVAVSDLMRNFQGVGLKGGTIAINLRAGIGRDCPFQVYMDGVLIRTPFLRDDFASPKDLAGIEVYTNTASIPLQYKNIGGGAMCGVILVWTKSGR